MRHFQRLAAGVDVGPLLHAVMRQSDLWNTHRLRTTFDGSPHHAVDDIWLRFNDLAAYAADGDLAAIGDDLAAIDYPAFAKLPQARPIIFDLMRRVEGLRLGRVIITRLAPGRTIAAHADTRGAYAARYARYHAVLQGLPGSLFRAGAETVCMQTGEVWWFDGAAEHEVVNNAADDRIHLVIDIETSR